MNITPINNSNNTSFNSLYASKSTLKAIGCTRKELLNNRSIKEAAEKYDVLIKAGNQDIYKYDPWWPLNSIARTVLTGMGVATATAVTVMMSTDVVALGILNYMGICAIPTFATLWLNYLYDKHKCKPVKEIVIQAGKGVDANEDYIKNCRTRKHVIEMTTTDLPLTQEVKQAETAAFNRKIQDYDTDDLFAAKKYLDALKQADIEILGGGDFFNRPIDRQGNTMLTQFFDVIPTKENQKEYQEILNIMKNVKGINFNQKDGNGISCIEKIINAENERVLPLIAGAEFDYSSEIEILYNHIQDKRFKQRFNDAGVIFNFNDILQAVRLNSWHSLTRLRPQLNSPLCNRRHLANQIEELLIEKTNRPQNRSDYTALEYVYTHYNEYVNPNKVVRLNEWNNLVDENGELENNW